MDFIQSILVVFFLFLVIGLLVFGTISLVAGLFLLFVSIVREVVESLKCKIVSRKKRSV